MKKSKQNMIPTIKDFTDEDGKKWIQTSTNDFLSLKELSDMLESIENDKDSGETIFARIEFYKVNQEYHDLAVSLQEKLTKQTELLKKVIDQSKNIIDKKNDKLKELITYIRKLHNYFEYIKLNEKEPDFTVPSEIKAHDWKSDNLISNLKDFSEEEHVAMKLKKEIKNNDQDDENNHEKKYNQEGITGMDTKEKNELPENSELTDIKLSEIKTSDGEEFEMMMLDDVEIFMSDLKETTKSSGLPSDKKNIEINNDKIKEEDLDENIDPNFNELIVESNTK